MFIELGDKVLLGPQNIARVISIPEPEMVLVQMDVVPGLLSEKFCTFLTWIISLKIIPDENCFMSLFKVIVIFHFYCHISLHI